MAEYIPKALRREVERRARRLCEYCRCPMDINTDPFEAEHIVPVIRGGQTASENLALSCSGCNSHKYDKVEGYDTVSEQTVPLYHPRQHSWSAHFAWNEECAHLIGLSPIGRATITALHLNRPPVVNLRYVLFLVGAHPPADRENSG